MANGGTNLAKDTGTPASIIDLNRFYSLMPAVAALERQIASSVEVQRAKDGPFYWTIKVYFDGDDPTEREDVALKLFAIDEKLRACFLAGTKPLAGTYGGWDKDTGEPVGLPAKEKGNG